MFMRETVGSLRGYFILVALFGLSKSVPILFNAHAQLAFQIGATIGMLINLAYLFMGIFVNKLLASRPNLLRGVIIANLVVYILMFLLSLLGGINLVAIAQAIFALLISWYLWVNVNRLANEAA